MRQDNEIKKKTVVVAITLSLLFSVPVSIKTAQAQEVQFINVDLSQPPSITTDDFPFGITCDDPDFVYMTIFHQGLLAKVNKQTKVVEQLIDDPEGPTEDQNFYGIARDGSGNLFINELSSGRAWRFEPSSENWTLFPLIEEIVNTNLVYPLGYSTRPNTVEVDESTAPDVPPDHSPHLYVFDVPSQGGVVFANGFIWIGLTYGLDFDEFANAVGVEDINFSGLVRVDPATLEVTRIAIPGAGFIASLNVDSTDPSVIWIADKGVFDPELGLTVGDKIYRFSAAASEVVQTIPFGDLDDPNHIATDGGFIYVALNEFNFFGEVTESGPFSKIAQINRLTLERTDIDTGAPNFNAGTFTVFVNDENDYLVWTDQSGHVGTIDLLDGEKTFETTGEFDRNHFGCPVGEEFWFASQGSAKVGIQPTSKFSVGGLKRPSGKGGSDAVARSTSSPFAQTDTQPPVIGQVITSSGSLTISAMITDDVAVLDANTIIGKKARAMQQSSGNPLVWRVTIPSEELPAGEVFFRIIARDIALNTAQYEGSAESTGSAGGGSGGPLSVIAPLTQGIHNSAYSIVGSGLTQDTKTMNLQVTIKNTSSEPLQNIRIMLSPELKGKFLLSDYAIKSIDPNSEHVITLKLNGKPSVDVTGEPIPYNGRIIVSVDNKSPYILELSGAIPNESASLQSLFMKTVASKGEQRYKSFVKPDERISEAEYNVKLGSGENVIRSTSDELIISNTGDKPLKNLRIMTSSIADHFIPELKTIDSLPAGSFIKVKLVSKMNDAVTRDLSGEVIIAPENGVPVVVPVSISKRLVEDKNMMYEIRTISGNNAISNTADGIVISNGSEESIDNVRIILPQQLARVFSLSDDSFKSIEPNSEKTVYLQARGSNTNARQVLNDYRGEMIIVSSDGMKKILPISIVWKGISSEHFVINARDNPEELTKAAQVINFLERSYEQTSRLIGETDTKTVIYMTSSLDELRTLSNALTPSTFVYAEDVGFVWSNSEDVNMLALKQFTYRTIMQNYGTYWVKQKISSDKGNWLVDGISDYVAASIAGEKGTIKNNLEAFVAEPTSFEYYGPSSLSQHGASFTLIKYLADKYGEGIIDKILNNLGSTMINNNRCDTLEQCVLVKGVYEISGLNMNDKRHDISFDTIMQEWEQYLQDEYGINDLNGYNTNS